MKKVILSVLVLFSVNSAHANVWTKPAYIKDLAAWSTWYGVGLTNETTAITGCSGTGVKAIDLATTSEVKKAQMALLLAAYSQRKRVSLFFERCASSGGVSVNVITNVKIMD